MYLCNFFFFISASLKPSSKIFSEKKFFSDLSYQESVLEGIRLKLVWSSSKKEKCGEIMNEKENSNYSMDDNNKDKEKGKTKESDEFLPAYLALLPTIIGSDVCVNCKGTRFAGPFLVCGICNGKMRYPNKKTDRVIDTLMIVHHFFCYYCLVACIVTLMLVTI